MSSNPIQPSQKPLPRLPLQSRPDLAQWWVQKPDIAEGLTFPSKEISSQPSKIIDTQTPVDSNCFKKFCATFRAKWDRGTLVFVTSLAKPSTILGITLVLVGFIGLLTAITGVKISALSFIVDHMPISIILSLLLIRAGLHSILKGDKLNRRKQRYRLEIKLYNHMLRTHQNTGGDLTCQAELIKEIQRLNKRLPPSMRIENLLKAGHPYGKMVDDIPTSSRESYLYRLKIQKFFGNGLLPELEVPDQFTGSLDNAASIVEPRKPQNPPPATFTKKWSDWWHKQIPALGVVDMVLGQLMLLCGIGALVIMLMHAHSAPPVIEILAKDPSISISFACILLINWVNCTRTGWRMLNWEQREARRNAVEADLQLADLKLERQKVGEFHQWCKKTLTHPTLTHMREAIDKMYNDYLESLPNQEEFERLTEEADALRKKGNQEPNNSVIRGLRTIGKQVVPRIASISIVLGTIITLMGMAFLVMSIAHHIPSSFELLTENTPLSVLFSAGLLVAGFHSIHRGVAMSERKTKDKGKVSSQKIREKFLTAHPLPPLPLSAPSSRAAARRVVTEIEILQPDDNKEMSEMIRIQCEKLADKWFDFWKGSLKVMWLPDLILGSFLLFSSLAGLAICMGASPHASFDFIVSDPEFSSSFCIGLLGIAFDALNTSWRMGTYHKRRKRDEANINFLKESYNRLIAPPQLPHASIRV